MIWYDIPNERWCRMITCGGFCVYRGIYIQVYRSFRLCLSGVQWPCGMWPAVGPRSVDVTKWLGKWFHSGTGNRVIEWCCPVVPEPEPRIASHRIAYRDDCHCHCRCYVARRGSHGHIDTVRVASVKSVWDLVCAWHATRSAMSRLAPAPPRPPAMTSHPRQDTSRVAYTPVCIRAV